MSTEIIFIVIGAIVGVATGRLIEKLPIKLDWVGWGVAFALGTYILVTR